MKATKIVLVGLLAGAAAGALLGVLLSPGKGSEIRRRIRDKSGDFTEGLKDRYNEFAEGLKQKGNDYSQEADSQYAKGKKKFADVKKDAEYTTF